MLMPHHRDVSIAPQAILLRCGDKHGTVKKPHTPHSAQLCNLRIAQTQTHADRQ